ncbi:pilin [Marinomonas sp. A79]|uniref:Pilin n=1 Tax=Marinomonas vulgaris TaxID=2823372 RepID=A0ABS5HAF7_9GAMM|nr:pilin [Marinomonas vulgaris]MBR7888595.1 pilin [Marinomonas vulgaris]
MKLTYSGMRGFTLLELMVVIAIISILASLSAPTFTRQIAKANLIEAQNIATQHQSLVEEYILLNGSFPTDNEFDDIKQAVADDSIVQSIAVNDADSIIITLNSATGIDDSSTLTYTRDDDRNWQCTSDLDTNVLPLKCTSTSTTGGE